VDALCYSTTDFFAAGVQDNALGVLIGVDPVTGAGGANVWDEQTLVDFTAQTGQGIGAGPGGVRFALAVRRSTRVGLNHGLPVEGLGVFAEVPYTMTRRDVLEDNPDLLNFACQVLSQQVAPR
jgi:hypothetical protein